MTRTRTTTRILEIIPKISNGLRIDCCEGHSISSSFISIIRISFLSGFDIVHLIFVEFSTMLLLFNQFFIHKFSQSQLKEFPVSRRFLKEDIFIIFFGSLTKLLLEMSKNDSLVHMNKSVNSLEILFNLF